MKIALIADELTSLALKYQTNIKQITPFDYKLILKYWKPDILLVESSWLGQYKSWKFKIADYPDYPKRNNKPLQNVLTYAKELGIPTIFWNKEDDVHFDRFIDSAKLFDYIFTVDSNCIEKYKDIVKKETTVNTLMFSVQSQFHYFSGFNFKYNATNFVGSYSRHIHTKRRQWQNLLFESASSSGLGITIFDRNSNRKAQMYRYPQLNQLKVHSALRYDKTAQIYKDYTLSLNVNTIENSPTMFSRRLIEIIACGGIAVTTPSMAVDLLFTPYCTIVDSKEKMDALFYRVKKFGITSKDKEKARAGADYIAKHHTWKNRLETIQSLIEKR